MYVKKYAEENAVHAAEIRINYVYYVRDSSKLPKSIITVKSFVMFVN